MIKIFLTCLLLCVIAIDSIAQVEDSKRIDNGGSGDYKAIAAIEASLSDYVVYRPQNLNTATESEGPLPVVVFANGGCSDTSITHERVLSEIASYGYIVIAIGAMQRSLDDREIQSTDASMLTDAIDWIADQNADEESDYYGRADLDNVALSGQSCGGAQVLAVASDPRVEAYLMFNSGIGDMSMAGGTRESLEDLHGPIVYIVGGPSDVATANAEMDYERIDHVSVAFANLLKGGHMGTFEEENGGSFSRISLHWLDWQLKGRDVSADIFLESDLSGFEGWTMKAKNF